VIGTFGAVAGAYAAARPGYPAALFDALQDVAGRPLAGALVADVGAGTGIAARALRDRGATVVAIEPSAGMLAELSSRSPGVMVVRGDGNALPLRDHVADFVTYAQAFHWTDRARSIPEFRRVLRPGGTFAAWWNLSAREEPWQLAQERRLIAACPTYRVARSWYPGSRGGEEAVVPYGDDLPARTARFAWERMVPLDLHLANLNSKSYVAGLGAAGAAEFLKEERAILLGEFPDGVVPEHYRTILETVRV
jgi:SAM-dependent methyltransferase